MLGKFELFNPYFSNFLIENLVLFQVFCEGRQERSGNYYR